MSPAVSKRSRQLAPSLAVRRHRNGLLARIAPGPLPMPPQRPASGRQRQRAITNDEAKAKLKALLKDIIPYFVLLAGPVQALDW